MHLDFTTLQISGIFLVLLACFYPTLVIIWEILGVFKRFKGKIRGNLTNKRVVLKELSDWRFWVPIHNWILLKDLLMTKDFIEAFIEAKLNNGVEKDAKRKKNKDS